MGAADTIAALSTGALPSGVAIVRLSGAGCRSALETLAGGLPPARKLRLIMLRDRDGREIDQGFVAFHPSPRSFTGEDCAEFQVHGSRAVVARLLDVLTGLPDTRLAEAGEFTRRAFLNGKLDLSGAEALADLIDSETESQRRLSLSDSSTKQSALYNGWRAALVEIRAAFEAAIDFSDEADVPDAVPASVWARLSALRIEIAGHAGTFHRAEIVREGFDVVIAGSPNAGKSSLLNALAGRDAAIVTEEAGTTRDLIEVQLDIGGNKVRLTDTAGIREGAGRVEAIGIERARRRMEEADLVLLLRDLTRPNAVESFPEQFRNVLRIGTKADLGGADCCGIDMAVSVVSGQGLDGLVEAIGLRAEAAVGSVADLLPIRLRHVGLLNETLERLDAMSPTLPLEINAEQARLASASIGRITGAVDVEEILGVIFSRFCIGK